MWWDIRDATGIWLERAPDAARSEETLIERLNAEHEQHVRRFHQEKEQRRHALLERRAGTVMEREAEAILREANRPPDDEWQALA
jgi:hypothetical protein